MFPWITDVPYHNFHHAVDVTVSSYLILTACDARARLEPVDVCSLLVAAIGHDVGHPGLTNGSYQPRYTRAMRGGILSSAGGAGFHVHAQSDLFKEFGEQSPLEAMHSSKTLATATTDDSNILAGLSEQDVRMANFLLECVSPNS